MDGTGNRIAHDLRLADGNNEGAPQPLRYIIETISPLADTQKIQQPSAIIDYSAESDKQNDKKYSGFESHGEQKYDSSKLPYRKFICSNNPLQQKPQGIY